MPGRFRTAYSHHPSEGAGWRLRARSFKCIKYQKITLHVNKLLKNNMHGVTFTYILRAPVRKVVFEGELVPVGATPDMKDKFLLQSGPKYRLQLVSHKLKAEDNIHLSPNSKVNSKVLKGLRLSSIVPM